MENEYKYFEIPEVAFNTILEDLDRRGELLDFAFLLQNGEIAIRLSPYALICNKRTSLNSLRKKIAKLYE
jgi:hypothetical protein